MAIGPFAVDVLAETATGERVVIENQLGPTDHDHLGKLLTYMSNVGAKKAVWITADPRPEHVKAVECLNEVTPDDVALYLVRVRAYRIDGSRAAPHFSVVAGPVAERKRTERDVRDLAERERLLAREVSGEMSGPAVYPHDRVLVPDRPWRVQKVRPVDGGSAVLELEALDGEEPASLEALLTECRDILEIGNSSGRVMRRGWRVSKI